MPTATRSVDSTLAGLVPLAEAADMLPMRPHVSTLQTWATAGYLAGDGTRIYLRVARFGKRQFTHPDWLMQFATAISDADRRAVGGGK